MKKKYYLFKYNFKVVYFFTAVLAILVFTIFYYVYTGIYSIDSLIAFGESSDLSIILVIPYSILHEILHGVGYVLFGANYKKLVFGAHIEKGYLFCLCKQNITKKNALISLIFPFFFIGILTFIIGLLINSIVLIMLSIVNILGCSGDLVAFYNLSKLNNFEFTESDDPLTFGLYTSEDLSKKKMIGLTYVKKVDKLERNTLKKVDISNTTIILFVIFIVAIIIDILF